MEISIDDFNELKRLEESLWVSETRFDQKYMEQILSPDFVEFGCSGRIYKREETIGAAYQEIKARLPLQDFNAQLITEDVAQVTYVSSVQYDVLQVCNRSSLWIRSSSGWQLQFHQGTPLPGTQRPNLK